MGSQPYWDWTQHPDNFSQDALFDGSEYSMGGNGEYVPHELANGTVPGLPDPIVVTRPPGTGGGCVIDGPFANITLNLGPVFPIGNGTLTGLEYNPHCLTREFLQELAQQLLNNESVSELLSQPTMEEFRPLPDAGIHTGGHASAGGDVSDIFTSQHDPAFVFHHSQIDRLWAIRQEHIPGDRMYAISGTQTYQNSRVFSRF